MNVQLANVISDISGLTGQAIIRAIVAGERNPLKLAALSDPRVHASREEIAKSLEGNWRPELLFVLQQEVDMFDIYQTNRRVRPAIAEAPRQLDTSPPASTPDAKAQEQEASSQECPALRSQQRTAACHGRGPHPH
jgi:hypothetical protein